MASTLEEEAALIAAMEATGRVAVTVVGTSVQGRDIRLLRVGDPPPAATDPAVLLLTGAQHGNETAGREALLQLATYLSTTADPSELAFLADHGVLIMPTCNPDGVFVVQRNNANGADVNRDHIALATPEGRTIATVLRDARPALVVDLHQGGIAESAQLLGPTNVQVDPLAAARSVNVIDAIKVHFTNLGLTTGVWPGGAEETILRNNAGLRNLAGLVAEIDSGGPTEQQMIDAARAVADASLVYARGNAAGMLADVTAAGQARAAAGAAQQPFNLRTTTVSPGPLSYSLTADQITATAFHRSVMRIAGTGTVGMGQSAQPLIPFLLDQDAEFSVVSGTRVFAPEGGGGGGVPPVAVATIRSRVTWLACRLGDGRIIAELPDLRGSVSRVIGRYTDTSLDIPIPRGGPGTVPLDLVLQATAPGRTMLVAVVNDIPLWAGIPLPRTGGTGATLSVGAVSIEGYLAHRFVRDHQWLLQDEASVIAAGLLGDASSIPGVPGGGVGLVVDAPPTGRLRDRAYAGSDHATVYERLTELMAVEGGPEWTIDPDWADQAQTAVRLIARVRSRLGVTAGAPAAIFETTAQSVFGSQSAANATYELAEDFGGDRYANYVIAYSSGEGEDQPVSAPAFDADLLAAGAPIWERHFQPSSSITSVDVLDSHARGGLARARNGVTTLTISARWDAYPRYGVDWQLGDDIGWDLVGHRHPDGFVGQGRAVGFELDAEAGVIRPILQGDF